MKKFIFARLAVAAAVTVGLTNAVLSQDASPPAFLFGCSLPLSGPLVGIGGPIRQGIDLAAEMAATAAAPAKVSFACSDSKGDAKETVNIAERNVDVKDMLAAISDFTSTATMAAADAYKRGGMVQLTPTASHPDLVKMNEWMFRSSGTASTFIAPLADFTVKKLGKRQVAIVQVQSDWGQSMADSFVNKLEADGGKVTTRQVYNQGLTDFRSIIAQIERSKPDAIFIAMLEEEAPTFMRQREQLGLTGMPVIDSGVGLTERAMKLAGPSYEGMYSSRVYNPKRETTQTQQFIKAFKQKYDKEPDIWAAYGYDAANLLIDAARASLPTPTRESVRKNLAKTGRYEGANGTLIIDPETREVERTDLTIVQVKDNNVVYLP